MASDKIKFGILVEIGYDGTIGKDKAYHKVINDLLDLLCKFSIDSDRMFYRVLEIKTSEKKENKSYTKMLKDFSNDYAAVLIDLELPQHTVKSLGNVYEKHLKIARELEN